MTRSSKIFAVFVWGMAVGPGQAQTLPSAAEAAGAAAVTAGIILLGSRDHAVTSTTSTVSVVGMTGGSQSAFGHPGTSGNPPGNGTALPPGGAAGGAAFGTNTSGGVVLTLVTCGIGCILVATVTSTMDTTTTATTTTP